MHLGSASAFIVNSRAYLKSIVACRPLLVGCYLSWTCVIFLVLRTTALEKLFDRTQMVQTLDLVQRLTSCWQRGPVALLFLAIMLFSGCCGQNE